MKIHNILKKVFNYNFHTKQISFKTFPQAFKTVAAKIFELDLDKMIRILKGKQVK